MNNNMSMAKALTAYSRNYFRKLIYLIVFVGYGSGNAGSYEDFFAAVATDDSATVSALLRRGFDGNTRDPNGLTGLHVASREKSLNVASALLGWGKINVELRTSTDESPLMFAALNGLLDLSKVLIAKGADVNKPGWTPLHYAATRGHLAVMTLLLDNHAYIDASSPNNTTPLMMAAFYGTPSAVKLLLEAGADPLIKNDQGLSAIDFAHKNSRMDSAEIIAAFVRAKQPKGKW